MPGSYLNFPFNPELFSYQWRTADDPVRTALLNSGAMTPNTELRNLIANGSDVFTLPFYDIIGGDPGNYDGVEDIPVTGTTGRAQSGVVYGRTKGWNAQDFVHDFNSGADPMRQITSQVARYWSKQDQNTMLNIINGVFNIPDDNTDAWDEWGNHTLNLATTGGTVAEENTIGATTAGDAAQKAVGDNAGIFSLAWMHSKVANRLAGLQLLKFRVHTDANGMQRQLNIADFNGMTVIVDDGVPVVDSTSASGQKEYTTYLMGRGSLLYAPAPVKVPVEVNRDAKTKGGIDELITRKRQAIHPNGFTFKVPGSGYTHSPTNAQLGAGANWSIVGVPKAIAMARIITNG